MDKIDSAVKELLLERYTMFINGQVNPGAIAQANMDVKAYLHPIMDDIIIRLHTSIFGESLKKVHEVYPTDWKEALKDRFLPEFFRKWFPVKYKIIDIEVAALYPSYVLPIQKYGPIKVVAMDKSRNYYQYRQDDED